MKKLLLLLLFIPHVSFGQVKNGEYNTYYESGELLSTVNFVYDLRQGQLKGYYESGELEFTFSYVDDLKQG
jgi:antitoxin component YwqK of YwqJK toxin-antitoxin module